MWCTVGHIVITCFKRKLILFVHVLHYVNTFKCNSFRVIIAIYLLQPIIITFKCIKYSYVCKITRYPCLQYELRYVCM